MSINWEHDVAKEELAFLVKLFGEPSVLERRAGGLAIWNAATLQKTKLFGLPNCLDEYELRDESVFHKFPREHYDNQYASIVVDVDPKSLQFVMSLTGAIMYDPLKRLLTSRCGDLVANIATLYLALRILENPMRLKSIQDQKLYARLLNSMYKFGGIRGFNKEQSTRVYKQLCRLKLDLPQTPNKGFWRGAFNEFGGKADTIKLDMHMDLITQKKAEMAQRRSNKTRNEQEMDLSSRIWEGESYKNTYTPVLKNTSNASNSKNVQNVRNVQNAKNSGSTKMDQILAYENKDSKDIDLGLSELYENAEYREVHISSVEPFNSGSSANIDLGLAGLYDRAQYGDKKVKITSVEPFRSGSSADIGLGLADLYDRSQYGDRNVKITSVEPMVPGAKVEDAFDRIEDTNEWAHQLANAENTNVANSATSGTHNRANAREYFCGRRQYNPDIPPCAGDHAPDKKCDPCDNYVKVYHTGQRPIESSDPTCFYGRRQNPYVDAAAYMRHFEDNAHDEKFYNNFY